MNSPFSVPWGHGRSRQCWGCGLTQRVGQLGGRAAEDSRRAAEDSRRATDELCERRCARRQAVGSRSCTATQPRRTTALRARRRPYSQQWLHLPF